ncbi:hypothetical protein PENSUB_2366 [Penicillium subrubescens]|uniref:RNase H type-1 domain-containing protein n=1 Tax=Penicillium subrubescens TaxID=1316194 RepID=A0A1Q5URI8_9EURO|nr:hypothetical protein PENSUB_2366 [Penicillium subrubescens]
MSLGSDCQAAIQAVQNPKRSSGQFVLSAIYNHVRALRSQTPTFDQIPIEIRWIPAHVGVPGNETADVEAKLAATEGRVENGAEQPYPEGSAGRVLLAATAKRRVRRRIKERWAQEWAKERTGKPNQRLVKVPDKKASWDSSDTSKSNQQAMTTTRQDDLAGTGGEDAG